MAKAFSMTTFTDEILQHANSTFSVLHNRLFKKIWGDNNTTAKLHHNQCYTDWQNGRYEVYIPTRDSVDFNLEYSRIAIQVMPMISNEEKHAHAYKLAEPIKTPLGKIESELLILVAPRQYSWGLVKAFKHRNKPGYFTGVFVNKSPDIIWKRVLDQVINFFSKRLTGLFRSLGFEDWVWKWLLQKEENMLYYSRILERFSYVLRQSAFTFIGLYRFFMDKIREVLHEIGTQNMALQCVKRLKQVPLADLSRVFSIIREQLEVELSSNLDAGASRLLQVYSKEVKH